MPNPLFQTRTDWTATARCISLATGKDCDRLYLLKVANGTKRSSRLSSLLASHEVRKVDWRVVALEASDYRPTPYKPRYVYEVAKGFRKNKNLHRVLVAWGLAKEEAGK